MSNLIELIVEGEGEDGGADDLCDQNAHEEEQIAIQGSLDGGELVLGDLGVETDLGLGAGVHADRVHLPGMDQMSIKTPKNLIVVFSYKFTSKDTWRQVFICLRPPPLLGFCMG